MNYWINTVSQDHVLLGVAGGFTQANHGSPRNLQKMKHGDLIVFYAPKTKFRQGQPLQCFTAMGKINDEEPFQVVISANFMPFRRQVIFFESQAAPIHPLVNELDFIKNKTNWGFPFWRGLFMIAKPDFIKIAEAMKVNRKLIE